MLLAQFGDGHMILLDIVGFGFARKINDVSTDVYLTGIDAIPM